MKLFVNYDRDETVGGGGDGNGCVKGAFLRYPRVVVASF